MVTFSSHNRNAIYDRLTQDKLDVLIIGGGITGAGIALDAVTRGMRTGLIEMQDFAAGTSSRSTKLVHGGLRYLNQFEVKVVSETGRERAIVYENGPHVTTPEWMMLPFHKGGTFGPLLTNIGLRMYDFLAGVKKAERRKMLSQEETLEKEPLVKRDGLRGSGYYVEYKTDDARLTIEVLKKAVEHGVCAINYAKAAELLYDGSGQITGVAAVDQITGVKREIYAKKVINAAGPWLDEVREKDGSRQGKTLHLTKGVHLVFDQKKFPLSQAIYFDAPDGRMIFAIPREEKTYVGTTDTDYAGDIAHPAVTAEDRDYLIHAISHMFPSADITAADVESSWAGLRPLIAQEGKDDPDEISRKDEIFISDSGLISMAGGKLTGYRKMAEEAVDAVAGKLQQEDGILYSDSNTKHLPISGGEVCGSAGFERFKACKLKEGTNLGLTAKEAGTLIRQYGANIDIVFNICKDREAEAKNEQIDKIVFAELVYAMEYESAYKPTDFFIRRTGALFFRIDWVREHQDRVISYMARALAWNEAQKEQYTDELEKLLDEAVSPVHNKAN